MNKKIPMRMCTGCRENKPKKDFIRVVKSPEGEISMDLTGRKPGRGAYICRNAECLKKAIKNRGIERALGVSLSDEVYQQLLSEMPADDE